MHRQRTSSLLLAGVIIALAGCATTAPFSTDTSSVQPSPSPQDETPVAPVEATPLASTPPSNPAAARIALPGLATGGVALGSVVVTNPLAPRTLDLTARPDDIWDRIRTGFAIPNIESPIVAQQQAWYLVHPDYLRRAVDRSSRYLYHVVEELNKRGMPTELALLPFVESAYNPMAYSRARASGMWQFIPGTGKSYNLKQDWWRDERRDVIASTDAALSYLKTIYEMHGDWHLALASYNWGEGSVKRAIEKNRAAGMPTDYLNLSMPDETRNYVPRLQALKNIIANPDAFGVVLPKIDNEPYFAAVTRTRDIDVRTAARFADMSIEDFKALNPSFNRPVILGSSGAPLLVPAEKLGIFKANLETHTQPLATWQAHTAKRGERIESVAARYGMTTATLREVNGIGAKGRVRPGQTLLVQKLGGGESNIRLASFEAPVATSLTMANVSASASNAAEPTSYVVKRGDTVYSIAKHFRTSVESLRARNGVKANNVTVGQRLVVANALAATNTQAASKKNAVRAVRVTGKQLQPRATHHARQKSL